MRGLQVLMPMAGAGSRFANAGFTTPKPLIPVDKTPMFQKAISSIKSIEAKIEYIFVIRQGHVETQQLDKLIKSVLPQAKIVVIPELTRGAAETALAAKNTLNAGDGLIIMDCDIWFSSHGYDDMVTKSLKEESDIAGGLLTFEANNPRYSYAEYDSDGLVKRTAEKNVISSHAITGAYYFANGHLFIEAAKKLLSRPLDQKMPEYYISFLYNILINEGKKIKAASVEEFASFGTPEELSLYKKQ